MNNCYLSVQSIVETIDEKKEATKKTNSLVLISDEVIKELCKNNNIEKEALPSDYIKFVDKYTKDVYEIVLAPYVTDSFAMFTINKIISNNPKYNGIYVGPNFADDINVVCVTTAQEEKVPVGKIQKT